MPQIICLQHVPFEGPGVFGDELARLGCDVRSVRLYDGEAPPDLDEGDGLLVMGGPMNVDETEAYPFLAREVVLLREAIRRDFPTLGLCLGAQLIAKSAGEAVYPKRPKEIGLFDVRWTGAAADDRLFADLPPATEVLQWHGDTFDLPAGAVLLASSERFANQAFRIGGRVYALQFHLEMDELGLAALQDACAAELADLPAEDDFSQYCDRLPESLARQNEIARAVIRRFVGLIN